MIKIERNHLDIIADNYLKKLQGKGYYKSGRLVRTHFIDNMERIILAPPKDFASIIDEFTKSLRNKVQKALMILKLIWKINTKQCEMTMVIERIKRKSLSIL